MPGTKQLLANYANKAADLAEAIKRDLQKGGVITKKTELALKDFVIAANMVDDMINAVKEGTVALN